MLLATRTKTVRSLSFS